MRGTPEERFWAKVDKSGDCWLWTGKPNQSGHAQFLINGKKVMAHRFAWKLLRGPIPDGLVLDHDNPDYGCGQPLCVNPAHLEPVTRTVNNRRKRGLAANNTSGVRGVSWDAAAGKWRAQCIFDGVRHHGGYFDQLEDAEAAAIALRQRLFGEV